MNRAKLRKHLNRLKLFPATLPLESLAIDILGPLPKTKARKRFLLVITDRFTKLTQVVALRTITAYTVAVAFCDAWIFKYGVPRPSSSTARAGFSGLRTYLRRRITRKRTENSSDTTERSPQCFATT